MVAKQTQSDNTIFMSQSNDSGHLLLVRHGEQIWPQPDSPLIDWVDPDLSPLGQKQATAVGDYLASSTIDAVFSSSLIRAKDTAAAIAQHHQTTPTAIADLDEIRMFSELPQDVSAVTTLGIATFAAMHQTFGQTQKWDAYEHGERSAEFRQRVSTAIANILTDYSGQTIAVVCHGGVINAYLSELLGLEADMFMRPKHCSVSRLRFDDEGPVIDTLNEYRFLAEAGLTNSGKPSWQT